VGRSAAAARAKFLDAVENPRTRQHEDIIEAVDTLQTQAEALRSFQKVRGEDMLDPDVIRAREKYLDVSMGMESNLRGKMTFDEALRTSIEKNDPDNANQRGFETYLGKLRGDRSVLRNYLFLAQYNRNIEEGMPKKKAERAAIAKVEGVVLMTDDAKVKYETFMATYRRRLKAGAKPKRAFQVALQKVEGRDVRGSVEGKYRNFLDVFQAKVQAEREKPQEDRRKPSQLIRSSAAKAEGVGMLRKETKAKYSDFLSQSSVTDRRQRMMTRHQERATPEQLEAFIPHLESNLKSDLKWEEAITGAASSVTPDWESMDDYRRRTVRTEYVKALENDGDRARKLTFLSNFQETLRTEEFYGATSGAKKIEAFKIALERTVGRRRSQNPEVVKEYKKALLEMLTR